ncbi:MAG: phospho-sugar mutase [Pirellulales bacterium]
MATSSLPDMDAILLQLDQATAAGHLTPGAHENLRVWLTEPHYAEYAPLIADHVTNNKWQALDDAFWTIIPFGTGGRRGRMYPIGSNTINDRTIGESAQGLANYVLQWRSTADGQSLAARHSCAIAYDTRHRSRHFAELCAEIMVAAGFQVYFLDGVRSTPELSYTVRAKGCACGIMVTASHNPPSDNAVKAYWSTGGQLYPPHDQGVIECVMSTEQIERVPFEEAVVDGRVKYCQDEMDKEFVNAVIQLATPGPRELHVIYSPLHGVGTTAICPVLEGAQFEQVEVFAPHAAPDGDFPNVPGNVSNPENSQVFDAIIEYAKKVGADLALASDPDCDRIGCAAPLLQGPDSPWHTLSGNQIGALLADFVLETRKQQGNLSSEDYVVQTLVTTQLIHRIADSYGVRTFGDLLVGFKWIVRVIDEVGPDHFVYGTEESHGYLAGTHVRDKDGAVAALLLCELAAQLKAQGQTLHEKLDALYWQHGVHEEHTVSVRMPGSEGMARMQEVMAQFRSEAPTEVAGSKVLQVRDYLQQHTQRPDGSLGPLAGPHGDLVILDLELAGNAIAIRPSGTEPKIKLYLFAFEPPEQLANLEDAKAKMRERLQQMEADMRKFAGV